MPTPLPPLPQALQLSAINSIFSLTASPASLSPTPVKTEVIHINDTSVWNSVIDKVLICLQEGNVNVNLEFIFPQVNEEEVEEEVTMEVETEKETEKESKPDNTTITRNQSSLDYSQSYYANAEKVENYFKSLPFNETLTPETS